jgi:ketosteroid isomerase-like protein
MTTLDRGLQAIAAESRRAELADTVRKLFDLRAKGDVEAILKWFAPDFIYKACGEWTRPPYVPRQCDRETFAESLRLVNVEFEELGSEIHELLIDGDRVAVHRTIRMRNRGAGAAVNLDEWDIFRFRERLVAQFAAYVDLAKLGGLERPSAVAPL